MKCPTLLWKKRDCQNAKKRKNTKTGASTGPGGRGISLKFILLNSIKCKKHKESVIFGMHRLVIFLHFFVFSKIQKTKNTQKSIFF